MRILSTYIFSVPEMFLQIKLSRDYSECQGLAIMVIIGPPRENFAHGRLSLGYILKLSHPNITYLWQKYFFIFFSHPLNILIFI